MIALTEANDVLGGSFLSRLNTDLRETKHWSYGVQGFINRPQHQVPYLIYSPVQTDQTGPSIAALRSDIEELPRLQWRHPGGAQPDHRRRDPGASRQFETSAAVMGGMQHRTCSTAVPTIITRRSPAVTAR